MALKIVTGGTTGAADGTLVSAGNKLTLTALSPSYINAHIRCDDGYWSADQAFTIPSNIEISFDGGSTWKGSADSPYTAPEIEDINFPIRIRQVASASGDLTLVTDGTYTAITALSTVSGLTATPGDAQVALSWSAVANRTYYQVQRATDSGFTANLTTLTSTLTSTSYTDTGRTNGTTYYYRVKALGTGRYSDSAAWSSTVSATPAASMNDTFASIDTSVWLVFQSGSGTVSASGGKAVLNKAAGSDMAMMVAKQFPIAHGGTKTVTALVDVSTWGGSFANGMGLNLFRKTAAPAGGDTFDGGTDVLAIDFQFDGSNKNYRFRYRHTDGSDYWSVGSAWSTTPVATVLPSGQSAQYQHVIQCDATNGVRMLFKSADGTTTHATSPWIPWANIGGSGSNYWVLLGGYQWTLNNAAMYGVVNYDSVVMS